MKINAIWTLLVLAFIYSCNAQEQEIQIKESQKKVFQKIVFERIDSVNYKPLEFGIVDNKYLTEKPEIKQLMPLYDSLYDTIKREIQRFIAINKSLLPYNPSFNKTLADYLDEDNYGDLNFYFNDIVFSWFYMFQENKLLVNKTDKFVEAIEEKVNRHRTKLFKGIEKYINSSYIDEIKHESTFWHSYKYMKDGKTFLSFIIVYFPPQNPGEFRIVNYW